MTQSFTHKIRLPLFCLAIIIFYTILQFSTPFIFGTDGHWHIRLSQKMWSEGIIYRLPELAFTIYNDYYREHHFLFQVLYMPFALFHDLYFGAKLAALFYACLAGITFAFLIYKNKYPYPVFWILLFLFGSQGFLERLMMPRVQSVSLIVLLLFVYYLFKEKKWIIAIISFAYVWLYDAFMLLFPILFLFILAEYLSGHTKSWKTVLYAFVGIIAGIIINPYFPQNIESYYFNVMRSLISTKGVSVGTEWQAYQFNFFIKTNLIIATLFIVSSFAFVKKHKDLIKDSKNRQIIFLALLAGLFFILSLKSRRFIEYMPPFVILFTAEMTRQLRSVGSKKMQIIGTIILIATLLAGSANTYALWKHARPNEKQICYKKASEWAAKHIKKNETLFTTDWDDFPHLYINAPHLKYIVGLDPLFMAQKDEDLYWQWVDLTQARGQENLVPRIKTLFDANYIFTDIDHLKFMDRLEKENQIYRLFSCQTNRIYKVK